MEKPPKKQTVYEDMRGYEDIQAKKIYKAGIVDISALAKAQARDVADSRMTESKEDRSKNWFSRTAKRIWKHNIAQEWYRNREIERVKKEIIDSDDLYRGETDKANIRHYEEAKKAIVERFTSEFEDEMLKKEEKDSKKTITDEKAKEDIKKLIQDFAGDPSMSEAAFKEEQSRILYNSNPEYAEKGKMYASNLLEIAKEIRNSVAHGEKLAEMDFEVEITLGQARESLNTEAQHNAFEKIIENTQNSKLGKYLFNEPASVALAAGLYSAGNFLGLKLLRSKIAKWGTFGATALLAGGISASKEAARLNRERAQHMRESAKGMEFKEDDMKRREEMEGNRYETKNAAEIIKKLEEGLAKVATGEIKEADLDSVLVDLSDLEARIKLGDEKKLDLVAYSKFSEVEKERMTLDLYRAKLKVAIRKGIAEGRIEFTKTDNFNTYLQQLVEVHCAKSSDLSKDIEEKNQIFKTMKTKKVAWAFAKTLLVGGAAGLAFQELRSLFQSETDGIVEGAVKYFKGDGQNVSSKTTAIEGLRQWISGDSSQLPFEGGDKVVIGNTHMQLPVGVTLSNNPDGTFNILRNNEIISSGTKLDFSPSGDLTDASKALLVKEGITTDFSQTGGKVSEQVKMTAEEYTQKHPELTQKINRNWMGNDTPMYRDGSGRLRGADLNELKTHWGGAGGKGIDANGNYVLTVQHMTNDGSFQDGISVAAKEEMKKGNLTMLVSATKGLQHTVFRVPIDTNGNVVVDPKSSIGQMMFKNENGRAVFIGKFAEIANLKGAAADGTENVQVLSTLVGTGHPGEVTDTITNDTTTPNIKLGVPASADWNFGEAPIFIPVAPRRPLEKGEYKKDLMAGGTYDEAYLDRDSMYADPTYTESGVYEDFTYEDITSESKEDFTYSEKCIADMKDYLEKNTEVGKPATKAYVEKYIEGMKDYLEKNTEVGKPATKAYVEKYIEGMKDYIENRTYVEKYIEGMKDYIENNPDTGNQAGRKYIAKMKDYLEKGDDIVLEKGNQAGRKYTEKYISAMKDYLGEIADSGNHEEKMYLEKYIAEMKYYLDKNTTTENHEGMISVEEYIYKMKDYLDKKDYLEKSSDMVLEKIKSMDKKDVEKYIAEMKEYAGSNIDIAMMEDLNKQIGEAMSNEARISIVLPCYKEGENIYKTLSDWTIAQKDISPEEVEIIMFVNAPKKDQPLDEKTISEISKFQKENPKYKVRLVKHNFDFKAGVKMGAVYKAPTDLSIYRNLKRLEAGVSPETVAGHLLRAGGADALGRNPRFLRETIDFMQSHQETEQLRTQSAYPPEVREKFPLFNLITVFNHSLSHLYTRGKSNIGLGTFRARVYAEASGFDASRSYREEIDLGMRIRDKVGKKKNAINKLVRKNAVDNPRRELFAMAQGNSVLNAYTNFSNPDRETAMRDFDWNKKLPENLRRNVEMNVSNMNREFDAYFQHYLGKVTKESGIISQILKGEVSTKSESLHPETRLLLKDPRMVAFLKEINESRKRGVEIKRSDEKVKKVAEHITKQLFDRILRLSFGLKKGPGKDYDYVQQGDNRMHIVFGSGALDKMNKAAKAKWENFDGYWDKKTKSKKEAKKPKESRKKTRERSKK